MSDFSEQHRAILTALCDTVVPSIERTPDPHGFFSRKASDLGVADGVMQLMLSMPDEQRIGLIGLLEALGAQNFTALSQRSREQVMLNLALLGPQPAAGIQGLVSMTLFLYYGLPDDLGRNPNWEAFGYPGPVSPPPQAEKALKPLVPEGDTVLEADVVVVGSGAGGGVMAGVLAQRGLQVVVLEAGGYFDESDFLQLELLAYQNTYWRGGPTPTADMNVSLQAGSCLGGGTTINWTNSLRTTPWVREQWEHEFGLEGLTGADFDRHLDAVWSRLQVNDRCSQLNLPQQRMQAAAERLGWHFALTNRNVDPQRYSYDTAGFIGFGDQTGAKQSTVKTFLADAAQYGALIVTRCAAQRVLIEQGRAAGVQATYADPQSGRTAAVTVRAPQVVVAAGALESPALLLRSGIGGPAVGDYLRLHPCTATFAYYEQDMEAWRGAPHAGLVEEFANRGDGYGFLIEGAQYTTAIAASALPYTTAVAHKEAMARFRHGATLIGLLRDHGHGRVEIDRHGQAVPWYSLSDERDIANAHAAIEAQIRLHVAAGAHQLVALTARAPRWRDGDDLESFIARVQRIPLRAGGWKLFSAHQMGTCRMGTDPQTSVAGPWGELHDAKGVWIGDGSAFPTPSGTNPMITIMALAHRNAEAIAAASARAGTRTGTPAAV
jgi:choline dehydrogenase-like flavoprotein